MAVPALRFGPYITPVTVPGSIVECEVRGLVTVVGVSDGPIRWPIGEQGGHQQLIVFKALARAVRQETAEAVASAWGVALSSVVEWKPKCQAPRRRKKQTVASPPIPWKASEDALIAQLSLAEAARLTGRTITAVRKRRRLLGLPDGRLAVQKAARAMDARQQLETTRHEVRARIDALAQSILMLTATCKNSRSAASFWQQQARSLPASAPRPSPLNH
jgi:hypothetical protein